MSVQTATAPDAPSVLTSGERAAFWKVFHHMESVIAELEADVVRYRELAQLSLAQQQAIEAENYRLRSSRAARGEMERRSVER